MNKRNSRGLVTTAGVVFACVSVAQSAPCALPSLSWMAGSWHNTSDPQRAQERWVVAPQNVLMGSSWEFPIGKSGFAEIMTVKPDGDGISMLLRHFDAGLNRAWEERDAPMIFKASVCGSNSVIFNGQGVHAGEHLTYQRSGKSLLIIGDFLHKGLPDHEEWHMIRSGD